MVASDVIRVELERIAAANEGRLSASGVLASARRESHPLHDHFEWDDSVAAREHRLWQARQLIKSVKIERVEGAPPEPMYVHIRNVSQADDSREGYYAPVAALSRDEWSIAMAAASRRLEQADYAVQVLQAHAKTRKRRAKTKAAREHLEKATSVLVGV